MIYIQEALSFSVFVLTLCFVAGYNYFPLKPKTVIKHVLPSNDTTSAFSGYQFIGKRLNKKKVIHFNFTGETPEDDKQTAVIQAEAKRLKYLGDTSSIIEIHLGSMSTYGRFVQMVNIMMKDDHKLYCLWKDNFYIIFTKQFN